MNNKLWTMKKKNIFLNYINLKQIILILILFCFSNTLFAINCFGIEIEK